MSSLTPSSPPSLEEPQTLQMYLPLSSLLPPTQATSQHSTAAPWTPATVAFCLVSVLHHSSTSYVLGNAVLAITQLQLPQLQLPQLQLLQRPLLHPCKSQSTSQTTATVLTT